MLDVFGSDCFSKGNQAPNILKISVINYIEEDSGRNNSNTAKLIQTYLSTRTSCIAISDSHSIRTRIIDWRKWAIEGEYESVKKDYDESFSHWRIFDKLPRQILSKFAFSTRVSSAKAWKYVLVFGSILPKLLGSMSKTSFITSCRSNTS